MHETMTYPRTISIKLCIHSHPCIQKMFSWRMENSCLLGMPSTEPTRVCLSRRCCRMIYGTAVTQVLWIIATKASRPNQQSLHSSYIKKCLAVIVSEDVSFLKDFSWTSYSSISMDKWPKIIMASTPTNLSIRAYDISIVPLDGPLQLIAQSERPIQGSYRTALSNDNTGVIVVTSDINMHSLLLGNLYRSNPQYCGLNDTEYMKLAVETSWNHTERFIRRMLEELQLQLDGKCNSIVPVSKQRQHN
jgi:hypothetical protein